MLTDANQAWDLHTARQMLNLMAPFEPYWLEEPLPANQVSELADLRRSTSIRIVAGENAYGRACFRTLLEAGAVDLVQPDVCKTGGLTEARAICQMAESYGVPYAPHYLGSAIGLVASLHLCASTPGFWRMELDANPNPFRSQLVGQALTVKDGCLSVPDGPGLGVEPESAIIEQYRIKY